MRRAVYFTIAVALLLLARSAHAEERRAVVLGEVGTHVARANVDLSKALRRALERELAALAARGAHASQRFVLSASVVKLEGRGAGGLECAVSAVLREQRSGAIRAVVVGKAQADADGAEAELGALEAAARGAVASLPDAIR